jgi:TrmH family RNA methyltransferase
LSREKLRDLRSLDSAKIRKRKGLCIVEGDRSLAEALRTGSLLYLVESDERRTQPDIPVKGIRPPEVPCYALGHRNFLEVSGVKSGTGLLGVARIPEQADTRALRTRKGRSVLLFLDGIQEPGNVGALIRTAWALGFEGVLTGDGTADPFSRKGIRASAGGVFRIPLYTAIGKSEIEDLIGGGYSVFVAQKDGSDYRSIKYPGRLVLALGNEGAGPSKWVLQCGKVVGIPMAEGVDSLNVVVAGGIIAAQMMAAPGRGDTETRGHGD